MDRAIAEWLCATTTNADHHNRSKLTVPYTRYGCMLLLRQDIFERLSEHEKQSLQAGRSVERLYELIAKYLKVTHVAITKPIPVHLGNDDRREDNILRAPSNFTPLYGDFGPTTCSSPPTQEDFDAAFWVTAKQNGIYQTWAPRWTMFSRGNISEKARLLRLPSVLEAVEEGRANGRRCAAVDLYAGIGYFAFSYLKAGMDKVLCWDLNPWSIEGLRRGAAANKWPVTTSCDDDDGAILDMDMDARLFVFNESNEYAASQIETLRQSLPPIRHVNCGLLPTSRGSWEIAFRALDPELDGWVHVHENFAVKQIDVKAEEVRIAFQQMLEGSHSRGNEVSLEHINRLKSYAPGVMHCVLDIYVPPHTPR